ncbi:UPF0481 protein At3g47200-like [Pistacia vera]|uniref:UPF0481 protein At3g47200-like n=1 Tax=Pistacia vera TaxID=55513 RepID=UPI0012636A2C|nr:UPF0481 protein At3g47200-like [Pistacia vera]
MSSKMSSSINIRDEDHEKLSKGLLINIRENFEPEPSPECCIYRVPKRLRMVNEKAYTPQLISIGPLHHGKEELVDMEKRKTIYLQSFFQRISVRKQVEILTFIKNNERRIRNCYAVSSKLESLDFVTMISYDALFILELFIRKHKGERDFYLDRPKMYSDIHLDIQLLENQLPYFVLDEIYKLALDNLDLESTPFKHLCSKFFDEDTIKSIPDKMMKVLHFTDLGRTALLKSCPLEKKSKGVIENIPNAVKLYESGVKFKCVNRDCLLDIRFEERKQRISYFKVKELQIPQVFVHDGTESLLRNIMALEQVHYPKDGWICNYVDLLDRLIKTEKDVDLLVGKGIILNWLGDNASVASMFNKLCEEIYPEESCYYTICRELKAHYSNPWNHGKAKLKSVYFSNPWRGTATIAAVVLLLLIVIQTVCSVL